MSDIRRHTISEKLFKNVKRSYKIGTESTFLNKTMNCLKAVILLWIGIIAFNASVSAYEIDDKDIRALKFTYCGGLLKSVDVYFIDKRNDWKLNDLFTFFQIPGAFGILRHLAIPYNQSPCGGEIQEIDLPVKLLESTVKQLHLNLSQKEKSRK